MVVENTSKKRNLWAMWDGKPYSFAPGDRQEVPEFIGLHLLYHLERHGLRRVSDGAEAVSVGESDAGAESTESEAVGRLATVVAAADGVGAERPKRGRRPARQRSE